MAGKVIEIFGVVGSGGGGGGDSDSHYYRDVQFSKWRKVGGEICSTALYVREPCREVEIRPWMKSINAGCMLHMTIRLTKQMVPEQFRGKVVTYFGKTRADKELLDSAKDKRPATLKIEPVGTFRLNPRHDCYESSITFGKYNVQLALETTRKAALEKLCQQIVTGKVLLPAFVVRLLDTIERDLLPVKNDDWLEPGDKKYLPLQFRRAFKPTFVSFTSSGKYEWIFDDGDMFMGHDVVVRGSLKGGPKMADLYG